MAIETKVDPKLLKAFDDYSKRVENLNNFWRQYALPLLQEEIKGVFESQGYSKWPPRKMPAPHPLLRDTGKLYNSWTKSGAAGNITRISKKSLQFGTNIEYAKYHEYGTSKMPARPIAKLVTQPQRGARRSLRRKVQESLYRYLTKDFR